MILQEKPDGAAVFVGTAAPNAAIRIFEGKFLLGKTIADPAGEWVVVLEKSLGVGQHLISIAMEREDGTVELADRSLAVEIYSDAETKPLVASLPETATEVPILIQSPDDDTPVTLQPSEIDTGTMNMKAQQETNNIGSDALRIDQTKLCQSDESIKSFCGDCPNLNNLA